MTHPKPVTAYAAVSPDGRLDRDTVGATEQIARNTASEWYEDYTTLEYRPVTILPTEQYEEMVGALEWYRDQASGCRRISSEGHKHRAALDSDGGRRARNALDALKEQNHG